MKLVILGAPRTKKTHQRIIKVNGKPRIIPAAANKLWAEKAIWQLKSAWAQMRQQVPLDCNVNVRALFYREANVGDAVGYYQALADALEAAGVVENDRQVVSWDGSRLLKDNKNPRIELELTPCD